MAARDHHEAEHDRRRLADVAAIGPLDATQLVDAVPEEGWVPPSDVPQGTAVFNADPILRRVMDPQRTMAHWSEFDEGGHFPAMEVPDLLVGDVREFFRGLR